MKRPEIKMCHPYDNYIWPDWSRVETTSDWWRIKYNEDWSIHSMMTKVTMTRKEYEEYTKPLPTP